MAERQHHLDLAPAELPALLAAAGFDGQAVLLAERRPLSWLAPEELDDTWRVEPFGAGLDYAEWSTGRVFSEALEVAWQPAPVAGRLWVTWTGEAAPPEPHEPGEPLPDDSEEQRYLCWGKRMDAAETWVADELGVPPEQAYVELQVPRVLTYPVAGVEADGRVRLVVREWFDGCDRIAWRCLRLEPAPLPAEAPA